MQCPLSQIKKYRKRQTPIEVVGNGNAKKTTMDNSTVKRNLQDMCMDKSTNMKKLKSTLVDEMDISMDEKLVKRKLTFEEDQTSTSMDTRTDTDKDAISQLY